MDETDHCDVFNGVYADDDDVFRASDLPDEYAFGVRDNACGE